MSQLKSAIIFQDRVFLPEHNSHRDMLKQLGIEDSKENEKRLFIRAELRPIYYDIFSDVETWQFIIDQKNTPDWYEPENDRQRMVDAVKKWANTHIYQNCGNLDISRKHGCYLENCSRVNLSKGSTATLFDNCFAFVYDDSAITLSGHSGATLSGDSAATLWGDSTVTLYENSTATLYDNSNAVLVSSSSTAILHDDSTATLWVDSSATLYGNSSATLMENSKVSLNEYSVGVIENCRQPGKKENCSLQDNATLKDCTTKTIYQSGDWEVVILS